jgi:YHS domain-containing protein
MRLLILILLIYLCYRMLKRWLLPQPGRGAFPRRSTGEIDDVMVKDPFCKAYFPKRTGVHANIDGEDLYFCSTECKERYVSSRRG